MKTIAELSGIAAKALVTQINTAGGKVENLILETGLKMFVIARTKPADAGLKKFLGECGVDTKKAPQNSFQIARAAFLIGPDDSSQPAVSEAPRVSEAAFVTGGTRTLMAVSTCLNTLERLVADHKIPAAEVPGHEVKLCSFIVNKDAKGAKAYHKTLTELAGEGGGDGDAEELPDDLSDAESILQALGAASLATPKAEWTPENSGKFRLLIGGLLDAMDAVDAKKAPAQAAA